MFKIIWGNVINTLTTYTLATFNDTFGFAATGAPMVVEQLLTSLAPQRLWQTGNLDYQRLVLKLAFSERLPYVRNKGFRTPAKALPFSLIEQIQNGEYKMVQLDRETSNALFKIFTEWNKVLTKKNECTNITFFTS